jgi:hypothetical protein
MFETFRTTRFKFLPTDELRIRDDAVTILVCRASWTTLLILEGFEDRLAGRLSKNYKILAEGFLHHRDFHILDYSTTLDKLAPFFLL